MTGLIVEALDGDGHWRYLQHLPELLTAADVDRAAGRLRSARAVLVQLQQPEEATTAAARHGRDGGALVVLDGVPEKKVLALSDVLRADDQEARLLTGVAADDREGGAGGGPRTAGRSPRPCCAATLRRLRRERR